MPPISNHKFFYSAPRLTPHYVTGNIYHSEIEKKLEKFTWVTLWGPAAAGKTTIAIDFADQVRSSRTKIWVNADTLSTEAEILQQIAEQLDVPFLKTAIETALQRLTPLVVIDGMTCAWLADRENVERWIQHWAKLRGPWILATSDSRPSGKSLEVKPLKQDQMFQIFFRNLQDSNCGQTTRLKANGRTYRKLETQFGGIARYLGGIPGVAEKLGQLGNLPIHAGNSLTILESFKKQILSTGHAPKVFEPFSVLARQWISQWGKSATELAALIAACPAGAYQDDLEDIFGSEFEKGLYEIGNDSSLATLPGVPNAGGQLLKFVEPFRRAINAELLRTAQPAAHAARQLAINYYLSDGTANKAAGLYKIAGFRRKWGHNLVSNGLHLLEDLIKSRGADSGNAALGLRYLLCVVEFLDSVGKHHRLADLMEIAIAAANNHPELSIEAATLRVHRANNWHIRKKDYAAARSDLHAAIPILKQSQQSATLSYALQRLAVIDIRQGALRSATAHLREAGRIAKRASLAGEYSRIAVLLADIARKRGHLNYAIRVLSAAKARLTRQEPFHFLVMVLQGLGEAHLQKGSLVDAIAKLKEALALARRYRWSWGIAQAALGLSRANIEANDHQVPRDMLALADDKAHLIKDSETLQAINELRKSFPAVFGSACPRGTRSLTRPSATSLPPKLQTIAPDKYLSLAELKTTLGLEDNTAESLRHLVGERRTSLNKNQRHEWDTNLYPRKGNTKPRQIRNTPAEWWQLICEIKHRSTKNAAKKRSSQIPHQSPP